MTTRPAVTLPAVVSSADERHACNATTGTRPQPAGSPVTRKLTVAVLGLIAAVAFVAAVGTTGWVAMGLAGVALVAGGVVAWLIAGAIRAAIARTEADARRRVQRATLDAAAATQAVREQLDARLTDLNPDRLVPLPDIVDALDERVRGSADYVQTLQQKLTDVDHARRNDAARLRATRGDSYVQFNRQLTKEHIHELAEHWAEKLSVPDKVAEGPMRYLERKLLTLEATLQGRLATSVENMAFRYLVAASLKQPEVHLVEVGVLYGINAILLHELLAPHHDRFRLTLIDPLEGYYGHQVPDTVTGLPVSRKVLEGNLRRANVPAEDIEILQGKSDEEHVLQAALPGGQKGYDLALLDGDHTARRLSRRLRALRRPRSPRRTDSFRRLRQRRMARRQTVRR